MSMAPPWSDFKSYCDEMGPGRGRPARPTPCVFCDGARVWFNGWRFVLITLVVDGQPHRPTECVPLPPGAPGGCAGGPGRSWHSSGDTLIGADPGDSGWLS
jgi:hypothetical protein